MGEKRKPDRRRTLVFSSLAVILLLLAVGAWRLMEASRSTGRVPRAPAEEKAQAAEASVQTGPQEVEGEAVHPGSEAGADTGRVKAVPKDTVSLNPQTVKLSDIRTEPVQYRRLAKEIQTVGEITYDERRVKVVSAWIGGRIDRLYVDFTGVVVRKGDPLADIYSPQLVSTQQEYLLALETKERMEAGGNEEAIQSASDLLNATRLRLLLWGISERQIDEMEKTWRINPQMTIHAPIGGTVIEKRVSEGQYVKTGDPLYTIVDLSVVWALADVYEFEMAWVKRGQKVSIATPAYPGKRFTGKVSFIDPFLDTKTRSVKVRMDVANARLKLKPGMFVEVKLKIPLEKQKPVLSIPYTAVLDTGVRKLVYVELEKGRYKPVEVRVGPRAGGYVPVLSGLKEGEEIVVSANYLIDSQSTIGGGTTGGFGGSLGGGHKGMN
ncbi:MAG: efflux RND transporter periplasmic adaptor subunit [Deltaproteobacteria bacterium]|nr:efflux RND transporter periplasmic adaptor subunit [Deltaproteobacteria bacterium]